MKILEKALKDSAKEKTSIMGSKEVLGNMKSSKMVVLSQSIPQMAAKKILDAAKKENVSTVQFDGTSVALGKLCGLQFRVSTISLTSLSDANIKSIIKESQKKE